MKLFKIRILRWLGMALFAGVFTFGLTNCAHQEASPEDPDGLFKEAEELYKDERYLMAIEKYRDIKNRFPYSSRSTDAELRIADCLYQQENYIEAASHYEIFKELHPNHKRVDYVQYQIAMSYYQQVPSNAARDLSAAYRAIEQFRVLVDSYPSSEYVAKAKEYSEESRKKLAEHEAYVGNFYFDREHYLSASYRYSFLLRTYPNLGYDEDTLYKLGVSYYNIRMNDNAKDALARLIKQYPQSGFKGEAESMLQALNKR